MLTCIAASYGTVTFTSDEQLKIEKRRPGNSYGKNIQHDGEAGRWMCTTKSRETGDGWAQLFDSAATTYRVAGHQTCANFTRCGLAVPIFFQALCTRRAASHIVCASCHIVCASCRMRILCVVL